VRVNLQTGMKFYGVGGPDKLGLKWEGFQEESLAQYVRENQWSLGFAGTSELAEIPSYEYYVDITNVSSM
jgi:hypothetical protein